MDAIALRRAYHGVVDALDLVRSSSLERAEGVARPERRQLLRELDSSVSGAIEAVQQLRIGNAQTARPLAAGRASLDAAHDAIRQLSRDGTTLRRQAPSGTVIEHHLDDAARSLRAVNVAEAPRPVALSFEDRWVWDSWFAEEVVDGRKRHHMFFLNAPKSLGDPELRHVNARVGHAVSDDLKTWTEVGEAIGPSTSPAWDDLATWTGSTVQAPDGTWVMYYTAVSKAEDGHVQRIGMATSKDMMTWTKHPDPILEANGAHYERLGDSSWVDEAWRDPQVFQDPATGTWHMFVTARAKVGDVDARGVVGHATSPDMKTWTAQPPLSAPDRFAEIEVLSHANPLTGPELTSSTYAHRQVGPDAISGMFSVPATTPAGPVDMRRAQPITTPELYAGHVVEGPDGTQQIFAFRDTDATGKFHGEVIGPIPYEP